jgi:hypothetical protein
MNHETRPENQPHCERFQRMNCDRVDCPFAHVRVSPTAPICRPFARYGYCERGDTCYERHVLLCPYYATYGRCIDRNCKLAHQVREHRRTLVRPTGRHKVLDLTRSNQETTNMEKPSSTTSDLTGLLPDFDAIHRTLEQSRREQSTQMDEEEADILGIDPSIFNETCDSSINETDTFE